MNTEATISAATSVRARKRDRGRAMASFAVPDACSCQFRRVSSPPVPELAAGLPR